MTLPCASMRLIRELSSPAPGSPAACSGLGRRRGGCRFCRLCPGLGLGRLRLVLGHMSGEHVSTDPLDIFSYRDRVAAGDRNLLLVVPFEAIARGHHIRRRCELQRLARDDARLLVDIPDGLVADDSLSFAFDRNVTVGVEAVDLGFAARALDGAVMRGQRVGVHLGRSALCRRVAAGDVDLRVLLPLDPRSGRDRDRPILRSGAEVQPLSGRRRGSRTIGRKAAKRAKSRSSGARNGDTGGAIEDRPEADLALGEWLAGMCLTLVTARLLRSGACRACLALGWGFRQREALRSACRRVGVARAPLGRRRRRRGDREAATAASIRAAVLLNRRGQCRRLGRGAARFGSLEEKMGLHR